MSASKAGSGVLDLAPGNGFARHSEGAFATLSDGTVLFIWSRFDAGSFHDDAGADLVAIRSADDGLTWSEPEVVLDRRDDDAINVMSVSLLRLHDGRLALFHLRRKGFHDMRLIMRTSSDEGASWSDGRCCIPALGYHVTNNDRVIQLSSGRLVVPAAFHRARDTGSGPEFDSWATTYFGWSDDLGETWHESRPSVLPYGSSRSGMQEPGVVELADGTLWGWARTDQGAQWEMYSRDGGETWSQPQPSAFSSPRSPLSVKRLASGRLAAVWNPLGAGPGQYRPPSGWNDGRTPLVMATGDGQATEWSDQVVLEDDPDSGYCYTAIHEVPGALLLAYCAGSAVQDGNCLTRLRIRRLPVDRSD
ncbi:sialidase family protein [Microlunatus sp. Y2014]|uniref:sialidase family protein n=1 Tax=Microlunatus sp. Y2014 TaxID=3418488 RepID=UPI003DA772E0